jgi:hypothetical protein
VLCFAKQTKKTLLFCTDYKCDWAGDVDFDNAKEPDYHFPRVPKLKIKQSRKKSLMTRRRFAEVIGLKLKVISVCNGRIKRIDVE